MILETGKHNSSRSQCAFTLIELILVMALLVVAVSIVAPRFSDFMRGRALDSEAQRLLALTDAGESRAVSEGMPMVLWFNTKQNTCGLEEETPPKGGDTKAENLSINESVAVTPVNTGASTMTTFDHLTAIRFLPDGTVDQNSPRTVQLTEGNDSLWMLELQNRTGYEISDSSK
ncbi:MAG TPA: prepilin-type N-terminal cleavage/methylation domain-containing protein [Verrucomicrobiae bacterium]|nr:prepilin-type N-terminal cleavage/methylation domain-containing protein [Verrucomicrobiae bacterium]